MPRTSQKPIGFTLVELLVVVTIISLLVSLILPSMQQARKVAKLTICSSNLRQSGISCLNYSIDFRQQLPINGKWGEINSGSCGIVYARASFYTAAELAIEPQHFSSLGLVWQLGYATDPTQFYCPAETNKSTATNWLDKSKVGLWPTIPLTSTTNGTQIQTSYADRTMWWNDANLTTNASIAKYPSAMMRNLEYNGMTCLNSYTTPVNDVGYLYCRPVFPTNPMTVLHVDASPVLMRSGAVFSYPLHGGYGIVGNAGGSNPVYNGWITSADVFFNTGVLKAPFTTFGPF